MEKDDYVRYEKWKSRQIPLDIMKKFYLRAAGKGGLSFKKTPFFKNRDQPVTLSYQETVDRYSFYKEEADIVREREYFLYSNRQRSSKTINCEKDINLHILHLKNAYIIRGVGIYTEDNCFIHPYFVGRCGEDIVKGGVISIQMTGKAQRRLPRQDVQTIEDDVFYCDVRDFGWGHLVLESIPALWALPHIGKKVMVATSVHPPVLQNCLTALEAGSAKAFSYGECVFCKSLYVAAQPLFIETYVARQAQRVWNKIGSAFNATGSDYGRKIYISRKNIGRRALVNQDKVDDIFRKNGFIPCFPEKMTFSEQVSMYCGADNIAALYGSGIFGSLFGQNPSSLFIVASEPGMCWHLGCFDEKWALGAFVEPQANAPKGGAQYIESWEVKDVEYLKSVVADL